jgi:hypothetical protein
MNKLIFAVIIIVVVATVSYSLYWYYYNEAKDAMSLVMPKLVYAQPNTTELWRDAGLYRPVPPNVTGVVMDSNMLSIPAFIIHQSEDMVVLSDNNNPVDFWNAVNIVRKQGFEIFDTVSMLDAYGSELYVIMMKR